MNTQLNLTYRDASNYKASSTVVLKGEITQELIDAITQNLEEGCMIIADQVGLPTPAEQLYAEFGGPGEDDHVFTAIEQWDEDQLTLADFLTQVPATLDMTIAEVAQSISKATWDVGKEMERQGIPL